MHLATLKYQFNLTDFVTKKVTEGLTHEDSLRQPQPGGNCLNWVLGHIVHSRNQAITALGQRTPYPKDRFARYQQGTPPLTDPSEVMRFEELMECFADLQEYLTKALDAMTPEQLAQKASFSPTGNPDETIGSLLAGFAFHEAYHVGQLGLLRRIAGKPNLLG
ncbi:MAG: DinB family protein [Candidatus Zixiibacteriota bacterium]